MVTGQPLDEQRLVGVLLSSVEIASGHGHERERGEREALFQRIVGQLGSNAALLGPSLGVVEAAEPCQHEWHPERGSTRE